MRQGQNNRRSRSRGGNSGGGNGGGGGGGGNNNNGGRRPNVPMRHQTFDSNGPDVRIRGNAFQVHEKYQQLARDAASSGDRVAAENYLQHAEHYFRIINAITEAENAQRSRHQQGAGNGAGNPQGNVNGHGNGNANGHPSLGLNGEDEGFDQDDEDDDGPDDRPPLNA